MKKVIGVRFKKSGKIYYFDPKDLEIEIGTKVIVETAMGDEYGETVLVDKEVQDDLEIKPVLRLVTEEDEKLRTELKSKEPEALKICEEKVKKHNLPMKLVDVEYKYDGTKLIFYFTADGRIDFRELVKDLAAIFRTRIELRQIGVRDEVRRLGGNGMCGRQLCCCSFLGCFETVSIKMAKDQNISLNPSKISGNCGRLMCCLKYEQNVYSEKLKRLPGIGSIVKTPDGTGEVTSVETLKEIVRVKYKENDEVFFKKHELKDIVVIKAAQVQEKNNEKNDDLKELEKMEKLDRIDNKNNSENY